MSLRAIHVFEVAVRAAGSGICLKQISSFIE